MAGAKLRFGSFIPPFHPVHDNPTLALERDLELVQLLDRLGYDEAWIGEHHSAGYEVITSPELFIATAAERTKHIKLGTGVSSLAYHHPLTLAGRINQLDHVTRGRVMFGVGPGALPSDAYMMGIDPGKQRDMMDESLDALVPLMKGETVNKETDWFTLREARLQMTPYTRPHVEMVVANQVSPTGVRAAGRHGIGVITIGATSVGGFNALSTNWAIAEDIARDNGHVMDRSKWRLVGPMHIAETREKAREQVQFGYENWRQYYNTVAALPLAPKDGSDPLQVQIDNGGAVVGTPEDAIEKLKALQEQSGGFGCFLMLANNWANWEDTKKSHELFARYVIPEFQDLNPNRKESLAWTKANYDTFLKQTRDAVGARIAAHIEEKGADNVRPEMLRALRYKKGEK